MTQPHRVRVRFQCAAGHQPHPLCLTVSRGLPPELRCPPDEGTGVGGGPGSCTLPPDLQQRVESELRDNLQEAKRRGYVLIN